MQKQLCQVRGQAHHRVEGDAGQQRGRARIDDRQNHDPQFLTLLCQVGRAIDLNLRIDPFDLQVAGVGDALSDADIAAHRVKGKAFVEHISKVEQQTARQGLQAQHAQQFGGTRIGFEELPSAHLQRKLPLHTGEVQGQR